MTSGEPEVVPHKRTWPPRPVAQLSRAIGRPFGTKYDNIDHNKAKKGPGGARGRTGSKNMAGTRFLTRDPDFLFDLRHITVSISYGGCIPDLQHVTVLTSKVSQSTQLLPVLQRHFRFDHDDFFTRFSNYDQFHDISENFGHF